MNDAERVEKVLQQAAQKVKELAEQSIAKGVVPEAGESEGAGDETKPTAEELVDQFYDRAFPALAKSVQEIIEREDETELEDLEPEFQKGIDDAGVPNYLPRVYDGDGAELDWGEVQTIPIHEMQARQESMEGMLVTLAKGMDALRKQTSDMLTFQAAIFTGFRKGGLIGMVDADAVANLGRKPSEITASRGIFSMSGIGGGGSSGELDPAAADAIMDLTLTDIDARIRKAIDGGAENLDAGFAKAIMARAASGATLEERRKLLEQLPQPYRAALAAKGGA